MRSVITKPWYSNAIHRSQLCSELHISGSQHSCTSLMLPCFRNLKRSSCSNLSSEVLSTHSMKIQESTFLPYRHSSSSRVVFFLTVTNFSYQRFNEHCLDSNERCFHLQLAGSSTARLLGILINPHKKKSVLNSFDLQWKFQEHHPNIKQGLTLLQELCA